MPDRHAHIDTVARLLIAVRRLRRCVEQASDRLSPQKWRVNAAPQDDLVPAMNQPVRKPFAQSDRLFVSACATAAFQSYAVAIISTDT